MDMYYAGFTVFLCVSLHLLWNLSVAFELCDACFTGRHCDQDVDECNLNATVCFNGASCTNRLGSFTCECTSGYIGRNCSLVNACYGDLGYCGNNGNCSLILSTNDIVKYSCSCHHGWTGTHCEHAVVGHHSFISLSILLIIVFSSSFLLHKVPSDV